MRERTRRPRLLHQKRGQEQHCGGGISRPAQPLASVTCLNPCPSATQILFSRALAVGWP